MADPLETDDEIKKAERYEALKRMLLRLLNDPQVQRKIIGLMHGWNFRLVTDDGNVEISGRDFR